LHQQAQLGEVQAYSQRYVDAVKLLLAAGGRVDLPPDRSRNAKAAFQLKP
jgi:hypothetical protein